LRDACSELKLELSDLQSEAVKMAECTEKEGGEIAQFLREVTIVDEGMALDQNEENLAFEKLKAARADAEQFSTQLSRARTDAMRLARKQQPIVRLHLQTGG